jgi:hypothetical protein
MRKVLRCFWCDEEGSASAEWLVLTSILLLGTVIGLAALHESSTAAVQAITAPDR